LVPSPFSDLSTDKFRPVIVVSNDDYNKRFQDFIAIPLTSNPKIRDHVIDISNKDLESGFIPMISGAKVNRIFSLKQKLATKKFGLLRQSVFDNAKKELLTVID
jgi:mRNA interferase MazF